METDMRSIIKILFVGILVIITCLPLFGCDTTNPTPKCGDCYVIRPGKPKLPGIPDGKGGCTPC